MEIRLGPLTLTFYPLPLFYKKNSKVISGLLRSYSTWSQLYFKIQKEKKNNKLTYKKKQKETDYVYQQ